MKKYRALRDTWLSHENRMVKEGQIFTTEFPLVKGKPMNIGSNLELLADEKAKPDEKAK